MCSAFAYFTNTAYAASMNARENLFKLAKKCNKNGERMRERRTKGGGGSRRIIKVMQHSVFVFPLKQNRTRVFDKVQ